MPGEVEGWGGTDPWGGNVGEAIAQGQADIAAMNGGYGGAGWDLSGMAIDPWGGNVAGAIAQGQRDIAAMGYGGGGSDPQAFWGGMLFDQTPITAQVPDLLTDLSRVTPDLFAQGPLGPSMSFSPPSMSQAIAPSMTMGMNPFASDLLDEIDRSTAHVNERDARTVAGVAMAENRGQGGLGMQSVMNAGMNRAANDWGGFGTSLAGQMTAPGQFAAPYAGPIDPNIMDMGRQAMAGTLPDLTGGAQSFRADRPSANDAAHRSLEALGSQSLYGHVFSDYASIPTPPERPAEFGGSLVGLDGTGGTPSLGTSGGLLADTFNAPEPVAAAAASPAPAGLLDGFTSVLDAAMGSARGIGTGIGSAFAAGLGPTNSIYDRVEEYTAPTGITGPKEYTDRPSSYREQPAPSVDQQMAAARADLASRMDQRNRDVVQGGYSFPYGEQRPSLQAFVDSPAMTAWNQGPAPATGYAQAPAPSPAQQSWAGSFLSGLGPSSAQAATPASPAAGFVAMAPPDLPAPVDVPTMAQPASYAPLGVPMPPERPFDLSPAPSAPRSAPMPPERPTDLVQAQEEKPSKGITMGDVAKYGMPIVGGLVGGPAGALAGMALYQGGSWLAGKIPDGTFGTPGGQPISDPYAYGPNNDYPSQPSQGAYGGSMPIAAAPAPAVVRTPQRAIHMPARNAWLSV